MAEAATVAAPSAASPAPAAGGTLLSTLRMAQLLTITPRRLQQLAKQGVVVGERDEWLVIPSVQGYIKFLRDRSMHEGEDGEVVSLHRVKARLMIAQAQRAEMETQEKKGELVAGEEFDRAVRAINFSWQAAAQSLVSELERDLAEVMDAHQRRRIIQEAVDRLRARQSTLEVVEAAAQQIAGAAT